MNAAQETSATAAHETRLSYLESVIQAQIEEMERDPTVILMGEDLQVYGGGKLFEKFDNTRIWSTPISEGGFTGVGIGAAIGGLRPIVDIGIASFCYLASDQIVNQAAKLRFMTGGQARIPIVFRCTMYYGSSIAAQHSDRPYPFFINVPGLKIVCPTTPAAMKGLLKSAIRDDNPVFVFEDTRLWALKGAVPTDRDCLVPIGVAEVLVKGADVTVIAIAGAMRAAMEAAESLQKEGISVELIDPRTLKPLDIDTICTSVAKTGRLLVVENAHRMGAMAAEIIAQVSEASFDSLKRAPMRLTAPDIHVPFSPSLEKAMYATASDIIAAVKRLL